MQFPNIIPQAYAACEADAEGAIQLTECYTVGVGSAEKVSDYFARPADLVNVLVPTAFIIAGMIIFAMLLWSGFKFLQDTSKGKDEARTIMTSAIVGIIVMFVAYWIVIIIGSVTGVDFGIRPTQFPATPSQPTNATIPLRGS